MPALDRPETPGQVNFRHSGHLPDTEVRIADYLKARQHEACRTCRIDAVAVTVASTKSEAYPLRIAHRVAEGSRVVDGI
jgi:hypothetical protein